MNLPYILQVQLCIALFWGAYKLFLQNSGAFSHNRIYLLGSMLLSFVIPALSIPLYPASGPAGIPFLLPEATGATGTPAPEADWEWKSILGWIYGAGVCLLLCGVLWQVLGLTRKLKHAHSTRFQQTRIVSCEKIHSPFSFFHYIFINSEQMNRPELPQVVAHELCHVRLYHSVDSVFIQILQILMWWNPFVWLWGRSLKEIHEYQADEAVLKQGFDSKQYITLLLGTLADMHPEFVSGFSYSLIKKRLLMIATKKEGKYARYQILLALPVVMLSLGLFACTEKETAEAIDQMLGVETREESQVTGPSGANFHFYVNGEQTEASVIETINPYAIASIQVIKDNPSNGADGEVHIILKEGDEITVSQVIPSSPQSGEAVNRREETASPEEATNIRIIGSGNLSDLQGELASVTLRKEATPGQIVVRSSGLSAAAEPLIYVNGKKATVSVMQALKSDQIEQIEVLKDAKATELYGKEAVNGVILITLKENS